MAITREETLYVARLARLALTDAEADLLRDQLGKLLDYMKQLDGLDTRDVVPTSHAVEMGTPVPGRFRASVRGQGSRS